LEAGVQMPPYSLVSGFSDALEFAHRFEFPIALKITSPAVVHKTDIGGVFPQISGSDALAIAIRKLLKISNDLEKKGKDAGIMAQKTVPSGVQVIVGIKKDEVFGRFLMIGAGGIYANLFDDQLIVVMPADRESIVRLLNESRIGKILTGYRTGKPFAVEKMLQIIMVIDELMTKCEIIKEIEINPIIVTDEDSFAVDARAFI
jgi:acetyltransferase